MMRNIKWGILGTGNIANSFASDFAYSKGGTMVSVASRNLENALSSVKNTTSIMPMGLMMSYLMIQT